MKPVSSLDEWTRSLLDKIRGQVDPIDRLTRLLRNFSPQIAKAVLDGDDERVFASRRREITVVCLDLRGFGSFSDSAEPEDVVELLRSYYAEMGKLIFRFEGTLERFAGDGIMVFFNDSTPIEDHTEKAVRMALEMRERAKELREGWLKDGYDLDLRVGLAAGFATLGIIGFEGRLDYGAVGNVTNLALRLCDEAQGGQVLTNQKTLCKVENIVDTEGFGAMQLKGIMRPVVAFNILDLKETKTRQAL